MPKGCGFERCWRCPDCCDEPDRPVRPSHLALFALFAAASMGSKHEARVRFSGSGLLLRMGEIRAESNDKKLNHHGEVEFCHQSRAVMRLQSRENGDSDSLCEPDVAGLGFIPVPIGLALGRA
jgi:hypothetical protein